jgi:adenylate cyclase class 2
MAGPIETEVKIPLSDSGVVLKQLDGAGFTPLTPRQFESNTIYDSSDQRLRQSGMILRLRETGGRSVITWKGPGELGKYKSRPELETTVGSVNVVEEILERLGFKRVFRYEKYRREFAAGEDSSGVVTVDETPIGHFLELEGPGDWIDKTAKQLHFSPKDYVTESYGDLYLKHCEQRGIEPRDMVFASLGYLSSRK